MKIIDAKVHDVRFPTAAAGDGSDAINRGDYSAAYVELHTESGLFGAGFTFTNGRGNEIACAAIEALAHHVVGRTLEEIFADPVAFWRSLSADVQLRWLGPEKGVIHMATGALVNAVWDLRAKAEGKPMWRLLAEMPAEELVNSVDFHHITDAITREEALELLRVDDGYAERLAVLERDGFPSYTTSVGWLGYPDEQVRELTRAAYAQGWRAMKMKVGGPIEDDIRRARLIREEIGPDALLMMDANQVWDVDEAIANMARLAAVDPYWIEEPTHADDVLGHARIARSLPPGCRVATGEVAANRVIFKQLLQAEAIGTCQVDACRVGGVNEVLSVLLMAAKFGVPVCPHAGGVGLCEYVQHLSIFDYLRVGTSLEGRMVEYVDHLHEHFVDPVVVVNGRYRLPTAPGYSVAMKPASVAEFRFPDGPAWR